MSTTTTQTPGGIRDAVMGIYDLVRMGITLSPDLRCLRNDIILLKYALAHPTRRRRHSMDVDQMVTKWTETLVILSTAHSKDALDTAEFGLDDLMAPLLTAPVAQLRTFYTQLRAALKADPRVPLFLWTMFEAWGHVKVENATDQDVRTLKTALAREIAELVERDVQPDIMEAIMGALQWRDPEQLTQMRDAVKAGAKPRIRGKESCLFLSAGGVEVML